MIGNSTPLKGKAAKFLRITLLRTNMSPVLVPVGKFSWYLPLKYLWPEMESFKRKWNFQFYLLQLNLLKITVQSKYSPRDIVRTISYPFNFFSRVTEFRVQHTDLPHLSMHFIPFVDKPPWLSVQCRQTKMPESGPKSLWGGMLHMPGMDLTEAGDIKTRWQEYTEEIYKKDLHDPE